MARRVVTQVEFQKNGSEAERGTEIDFSQGEVGWVMRCDNPAEEDFSKAANRLLGLLGFCIERPGALHHSHRNYICFSLNDTLEVEHGQDSPTEAV